MLPKFTIVESNGRFIAETDWCIPWQGGAFDSLMVDARGCLVRSHAGWAKREAAEAAIEECKRRLR